MMDFIPSNDSNIESLTARDIIAALERTIFSKNQKIAALEEEIKRKQQDIVTLKESHVPLIADHTTKIANTKVLEDISIVKDEVTNHTILDLVIIPEANKTKTAGKILEDSGVFPLKDSHGELLAAREMITALERTISSIDQTVSAQKEEIKSKQEQIQSQQQEILTLKESHVSNIKCLIAEHREEIAKIKTKVWCSNHCGKEGIFYCCLNVIYCDGQCQKQHWKENHQKKCKNNSDVETKLAKDDQNVAVLQGTIFSKNKKIADQEFQIKSMQEQIESQQQEIVTLKESHNDSKIQDLIAEHREEIAIIKTKVWCSNQCGKEGILHCCDNVTYCGVQCQTDQWKKSHYEICERDRTSKTKRKK